MRNLFKCIVISSFLLSCGSSSEEDKISYTVPSAASGSCHFAENESVCVNYNGVGHDKPSLSEYCTADEIQGSWKTLASSACSSSDIYAYCQFNADTDLEFFVYYYEGIIAGQGWTEQAARLDCSENGAKYRPEELGGIGTFVIL